MATLLDELDTLDLVLHVGDISYANGNPDIWDTFMHTIEPIAAHIPYMVRPGSELVLVGVLMLLTLQRCALLRQSCSVQTAPNNPLSSVAAPR